MIEASIIKKCQDGNRQAMEELYHNYASLVKGICKRYCQNDYEADDLLQEVFIKVFTKINSYKNKGSFEGWLRRITVNTAITAIRSKNKSNENIEIDQIDEKQLNEKDEEAAELAKQASVDKLYNALNKLNDGYRMVFNLYVIEGYSHKEIAKMLDISESSSRSQYMRAKQKLLNYIKENNKQYERE